MFNKNNIFYPIVYTDDDQKTIDFLKKFFEFETAYSDENYTVLKNRGLDKNYLGIMKPSQSLLDENIKPRDASGSVINIYVDNAGLAYQELEWNGGHILQEIKKSNCGSDFFAVRDPNGIIFLVTEMSKQTKEIIRQDKKTA